MVGLPRDAAGVQQLRPRGLLRRQAVVVHQQVVGPPRGREAATREPHELQRQREAKLEGHRDVPERAVGVREVDVGERHRGVGDHELGPIKNRARMAGL